MNNIVVSIGGVGVDRIHLVWVGVGIKQARGSMDLDKMHFCYYFSYSEGSRTRAQRLCDMEVGRNEGYFRVREGVGS